MYLQDNADVSRLVKIVGQTNDKLVKVRVYFKGSDPRQEPLYYGQTEVPVSLMDAKNERNKTLGFSIWDRDSEIRAYLAAQAPARDEEREQDDLDFWNEQEAA